MTFNPALTVAEHIRNNYNQFTRAERQLADSILKNYPISGLDGIITLAAAASVSAPTVIRMGKKIGFSSFPQMQAALHTELRATLSTPIAKHDRSKKATQSSDMLNRFAEATIGNIQQTLHQISPAQFNAAVSLLANEKHAIHIVGGRLTRSIADYLFTHMQVIRNGVTLIAPNANTWPHYILNIEKNDIVVIFDIRRYERETLKFAEMAKERKAQLILFTDQWGSPVAKFAAISFHARIEAPSAWDSSIASLLIVESLIAAVENVAWKKTRGRIKSLEKLYDRTGMFKKTS